MVLNDSSFIFVNSKDRSAGSNTNFTTFLNNYKYLRGSCSVAVEQVSFYNTQYPINSRNNILTFYENGGALETITFPEGSYTSAELVSQLKTSLETGASANTYTVTYSSITKKITIDVASGTSIRFDWTQTSYPMNKVIGFDSVTITSPTAATGSYPINLGGVLYVDLELGWHNNSIKTGQASNSVFHRIPLYGEFGSFIDFRANLSNDFAHISNEELSTLRIKFVNPDGSEYTIPDTFDTSIVLRIEKI